MSAMKTFCITGHDQAALDWLAAVLEKAGSVPALNSNRDAALSISEWHKMVAARNTSTTSDSSWSTGKFLEQIITDVFLANRLNPLWHWIDASSLMLLDYWEEFDPNINFLFVYESPVDTLTKVYESGSRSPCDFDKALAKWKERTDRLIRFVRRNSDKTLILSNSTLKSNPGSCIAEICKKWQLNLDEASELPPLEKTATPSIDMLLSCYVNEHIQIKVTEHEAQSLFSIASTEGEHRKFEKIIEEIDRRVAVPSQRNGMLLADFISKNNKDGESLYLESNLHACQERLEALYELHNQDHSAMLQYQSRLAQALHRHKCPWEFSTLKTEVVQSNEQGHYIEWQLADTYIDNVYYETLSFMTRTIDSMTGFVIKPVHTLSSLVYFDKTVDAQGILLFPTPGSYQQESNRRLSTLSTSAWRFIIALTSIMLRQLNTSSTSILPPGGNRKSVYTGLDNLYTTLQKWPNILRYDKANSAVNVDSNEAILHIFMENVELGEARRPGLTYCIHFDILEPTKRFSLRFPDSARSWFRNWYVNAPPGSHNRLILEFIAPDILPPETWSKLHNDDHLLVAAIIADMEQQLFRSQATFASADNTTDWKLVCRELKSIFVNAHKTSYQTHSN